MAFLATPDLARLAFGALLWIVLVVVNRGAAGASPTTDARIPTRGERSRRGKVE